MVRKCSHGGPNISMKFTGDGITPQATLNLLTNSKGSSHFSLKRACHMFGKINANVEAVSVVTGFSFTNVLDERRG